MPPLLVIVGLVIVLGKPSLPRLVGNLVWPQHVFVRRFGLMGLFFSWIVYYAMLLLAALALLVLFAMAGGTVVGHPHDLVILAGMVVLSSAVQAVLGHNPARAFDADVLAAHRLLDDLQRADMKRLADAVEARTVTRAAYESVLAGRDSQASVDHLVRILRQVAASDHPKSYTKTMAIHLVGRRLRRARQSLQRGSDRST